MLLTRIKFPLILFLLIILLNTPAHSELTGEIYQLSDELYIEKVNEDIYIVIHSFPWPANSMLVRCSDTVFVWVDTPYNDDATRKVLDWVTTHFGKMRIVEINTGFHNDNLGGNGYLNHKGIEIYGSDLTVKLLKEQAEQTRKQILKWLEEPKFKKYYDAHSKATYAEPNHIFEIDHGLNLILDGEQIEVYYPGPSHAADNVVVYFLRRKLLFGGCMVKSINSRNLGFTGDADMKQWPISLKKVLEKYGDAQIVVPGHGAIGGIELIKHTLTLF